MSVIKQLGKSHNSRQTCEPSAEAVVTKLHEKLTKIDTRLGHYLEPSVIKLPMHSGALSVKVYLRVGLGGIPVFSYFSVLFSSRYDIFMIIEKIIIEKNHAVFQYFTCGV